MGDKILLGAMLSLRREAITKDSHANPTGEDIQSVNKILKHKGVLIISKTPTNQATAEASETMETTVLRAVLGESPAGETAAVLPTITAEDSVQGKF